MSKQTRKAEKKSGSGKKLQHSPKPWRHSELLRSKIESQLDMQISLWYNKEVSQWRWTLTDPDDPAKMESGNSADVRQAMEDVANTVEWMMETQEE